MITKIIHALDREEVSNGNARYLCNKAVFPTWFKLTTDLNKVTCKNCNVIIKSIGEKDFIKLFWKKLNSKTKKCKYCVGKTCDLCIEKGIYLDHTEY